VLTAAADAGAAAGRRGGPVARLGAVAS